jgi:AraC-like DNA-binding protein
LNEADIYREWAPPPEWRHAVACLWEQRVRVERVQRVVPDGHADLLVHDTGVVQVVGVQDQVALPVLGAGARIFGVRLRPEAVAAAFRTSASSLLNRTVPVEDVVGAGPARRLLAPAGLDAWIRSIEPDGRATLALRLLATQTVAEVAGQLRMTTRQLQRVLRAEVGLAPKAYQQVARLQRFLREADAGRALAAAGANAGYADQAHLTRDVRRLTGLTPARLVAERRA